MVRGPYYDENGVKRGAWSKDEDETLKAYVERHGHSNWREVPKSAGLSRCGKSCRLRWVNYLQPNLKRGKYTQQEDQTITKLHEQHGNKWSLIAEKLPGRTDNGIKNHWHSLLRKRLECNHEMKSEIKMNTSAYSGKSKTSEREKAKHTTKTTENSVLGVDGVPSYNFLESSLPKDSETTCTEENNTTGPSELFEEFSNFWTEPFMLEDMCRQDMYPSIYAAIGVDMDDYVPYFFDNTESSFRMMQESPNDPI